MNTIKAWPFTYKVPANLDEVPNGLKFKAISIYYDQHKYTQMEMVCLFLLTVATENNRFKRWWLKFTLMRCDDWEIEWLGKLTEWVLFIEPEVLLHPETKADITTFIEGLTFKSFREMQVDIFDDNFKDIPLKLFYRSVLNRLAAKFTHVFQVSGNRAKVSPKTVNDTWLDILDTVATTPLKYDDTDNLPAFYVLMHLDKRIKENKESERQNKKRNG